MLYCLIMRALIHFIMHNVQLCNLVTRCVLVRFYIQNQYNTLAYINYMCIYTERVKGWQAKPVQQKEQPPPFTWHREEVERRLSPGNLDETHSSRRCCSDPWVWWPARRCGGRTQPRSFHMAQTQTRGCSRGTPWTAAFYGSRWQLSRNWPVEAKKHVLGRYA